MKLDNTVIDNLSVGFESSSQAYIKAENMGLIFDVLSKNFYSAPIESIVRELCNNSHDSFVAAGKNPVVTVRYLPEDRSIHFIDQGMGLSPDDMQNIYLSFGESTKRHSNEMIGSFGLGSKSPFSYVSSFFINTRRDGIEYQYLFSKPDLIPELDLLDELETMEENGTDVWFYLNPDRSGDIQEVEKFRRAVIRQLKYFDTVLVEGFAEYENEYKIIKGKSFICRPDLSNPGKNLEICFGKNVYPIDWHSIGEKSITLDCALYFDIGELSVVPNREVLKYDEKTIAAVKEKIFQVKQELAEIYNRNVKYSDTLFEYWEKMAKKAELIFDSGEILDLSGLDIKGNLVWRKIEHLNLRPTKNFEGKLPGFSIHYNPKYDRKSYRYTSAPSITQSGSFNDFYLSRSGPYSTVKNKQIGNYEAVICLQANPYISSSMISDFYEKEVIERKYVQDPITREYQYEIANPNGIDWEAEILEFIAILADELAGIYQDYDAIEIIRKERTYKKKADDEVLVMVNRGSRKAMLLSHVEYQAAHLIYTRDPTEVEYLTRLTQGNYQDKEAKGSKFKKVVAVINSPKKYEKAIRSLPNIMSVQDFMKSKMIDSMVLAYFGKLFRQRWNNLEEQLRWCFPSFHKMAKVIAGKTRSMTINEYLIERIVQERKLVDPYHRLMPEMAEKVEMTQKYQSVIDKRYRYNHTSTGKLYLGFQSLLAKYNKLKQIKNEQTTHSAQASGSEFDH